jgi:hypothetical protein
MCCQPCPYWRATWSAGAVAGTECVPHAIAGQCCTPPDLPYNVGVYALTGEVLAAYIAYRVTAMFPRCLPNDGHGCSPTAHTMEDRTDPVIAVCTVDAVGPGFPRRESILAFVVASRLRAHGGAVVGLFPMGLTKMPLGYGLDYAYRTRGAPRPDIDDHYARVDGTMVPAHGRPWARGVAPRMFQALTDEHPEATLVTRIHTPGGGVGVNKLVMRMADTEEFHGRVSIGFASLIKELDYDLAYDGLWMLIRGWFEGFEHVYGKDNSRLTVRIRADKDRVIEMSQVGTGNYMTCNAPALAGMLHGQTLHAGGARRMLSADDVGLLALLTVPRSVVRGPTPTRDAVTPPLVPSRLRINHVSEQVSVDGDWCASYSGNPTMRDILEGDTVHTHLGMLFCIYPQ